MRILIFVHYPKKSEMDRKVFSFPPWKRKLFGAQCGYFSTKSFVSFVCLDIVSWPPSFLHLEPVDIMPFSYQVSIEETTPASSPIGGKTLSTKMLPDKVSDWDCCFLYHPLSYKHDETK